MELYFTSLDGTQRLPFYQIGEYGTVGDLQVTTRWGDGACGLYEASWTMPLPANFEHPLLRRGSFVEAVGTSWRIGSRTLLAEPARGTGPDDPWQFVATGVGREAEGENSFYAIDSSGDPTDVASTAIDQAIARGLPWDGRDSTVPTFSVDTTTDLQTVGALLTAIGKVAPSLHRWGVGQDNIVGFMADPTEPAYHIAPGAASLGVADDDYATVVLFRYTDSTSHVPATVVSPASPSPTQQMFGPREFAFDATGDNYGEMSAATAQSYADGILARSKGRLNWTNGLTVTSNEILTSGGVPADLLKVLEDVGNGCMVRLHGIWDTLLEFTGQTWLDIIIGEAKYTDGADTIDLSPLGLAPRDLASVVESVTGMAA